MPLKCALLVCALPGEKHGMQFAQARYAVMQSEGGAGDTGLEIAPGSEAENAEALIADPGNIWNGVPQVCCPAALCIGLLTHAAL